MSLPSLPEIWPPWFWIVALFLIVDAFKVLIEIWNRPVRREFTSDLANLTALIPTHNGAGVLRETINDLLKAGLAHDRILVIDDGSTDATPKLLAELKVRSFRIPNMGKVSAINFGIHRVTTKYVLLLDDDTRVGAAKIPTSLLDRYDAVAFNVVPDRRDRYGPKGSGALAALQRYEYRKSMEIGRRFQDASASISCISGAIGLFKRERFNLIEEAPAGLRWVRFWDCAAKAAERNDYTVGVCCAMNKAGDLYIRSVVRGRWEYPDMNLYLLHRGGRFVPPKIRAFIDYMRSAFDVRGG